MPKFLNDKIWAWNALLCIVLSSVSYINSKTARTAVIVYNCILYNYHYSLVADCP